MSREIPEVVRAAAGLAATVLDEARKLPETLPGLPVRLIGIAMQQAMKVQQQYAGLVARGDELFTGLRGENEPGLATFDDDEPAPAPSNGFRESAFDRAGDNFPAAGTVSNTEALPDASAADVVDDLAEQIEIAEMTIEELAEEAPGTDEILDEIAIDELIDQAPTLEETAPVAPVLSVVVEAPAIEDADALDVAPPESGDSPAATDTPVETEPTADVAATVDVLTPAGEVATVEAAVTDEGIAAPEATDATDAGTDGPATATKPAKPRKAAKATAPKAPEAPAAGNTDTDAAATTAADTATDAGAAAGEAPGEATDESGSGVAAAPATPTDEPAGGSELSGSQAAGAAPVDGYDSFTIAQLRGRLRGYALSTVQDLVAYEEATRARADYLRMLRNRLEKLEEQAVASSPLAPRGA